MLSSLRKLESRIGAFIDIGSLSFLERRIQEILGLLYQPSALVPRTDQTREQHRVSELLRGKQLGTLPVHR